MADKKIRINYLYQNYKLCKISLKSISDLWVGLFFRLPLLDSALLYFLHIIVLCNFWLK